MRLEVVNRQFVQHIAVVAQIVFAICATPAWGAVWGDPAIARQSRPVLAVIGHPSAHEWKVVDHPAFVVVTIDGDVHPHAAAAYRKFAAIVGVTAEPLYVVMTPHLEPVAVCGREGLGPCLDDIARRWTSDREQLSAAAGLAVRRYLLEARASAPAASQRLEEAIGTARFDPVGGSFFRTSSSFDKSLEDQARFALEALRSGRYELARSMLDYVVAELRDPAGVFFAAQQADSLVPRGGPVMVEGGHYMWERRELEAILGSRLADIFAFHYLLDAQGRSVPRQARPSAETAARFSLSDQELEEALRSARQKLYDVRSKRPDPMPHPIVVTESNAMTVSALASASIVLNESRYADAAVRGIRALLKRNRKGGALFRSDGVRALPEDYAALTGALIDVYSATFDPAFIATAVDLRNEWLAAAPRSAVPPAVEALFVPPAVTNDPRLDGIMATAADQRQIVVSGEGWREETKALLQTARSRADHRTLIVLVSNARVRSQMGKWLPHIRNIAGPAGEPVAALCQDRTCSTPTTDRAIVAAW